MAGKAHTPSRRALLGALPAMALIGTGAATAVHAAEAENDTAEWDAAMAAYLAAKAEEDAFDRVFAQPAFDAYRSGLDAIPHTAVILPGENGHQICWSTRNSSEVAQARAIAADSPEWLARPERLELVARCRELVAASNQRDREIERLGASHNIDALLSRSGQLGDRTSDLKWQLIDLPAPHGEALLWKIENLVTPDAVSWNEEIVANLQADAARLLGGEA